MVIREARGPAAWAASGNVDEPFLASQQALGLGEGRGDGEEGLAHRVGEPDAVARPRTPRALRDHVAVAEDDDAVRLVALTFPAPRHPQHRVGGHALLLRGAAGECGVGDGGRGGRLGVAHVVSVGAGSRGGAR